MRKISYRVADEVFTRFPGYVRGVVTAQEVKNGESPSKLQEMLREAEVALQTRLTFEALSEHPHISCWREAYRSFGAKPTEYRPSVEALARRVLKGQALPSVNALVDIGNILTLRHLIPVGCHAIDVVQEDLSLCPAVGDEEFIAFGSAQIEHPLPGEIIFTEGKSVLTRRWTWRQANHTLTQNYSKAVEFNLDILPPVGQADLGIIAHELIDLVQRFCAGSCRFEILTATRPQIWLK